MPHDVFVSYSANDKPIADSVVACLESAVIRCWAAPRDILPGADWGGSINEAIKGARLMVVVFSQHSNASQHVLREVERAVHRGIPVIPFRIDSTLPTGSMEYFLSTPHWLDAMTPPIESHLNQLRDTALFLLKGTPPPPLPPPPIPRPFWQKHFFSLAGLAAILTLAAVWYLYRQSLPVDSAVAGNWRTQNAMPGTSDGVDDAMTISNGGAFTRTARYRVTRTYTRRTPTSFTTGDNSNGDIKGEERNGKLITPTCCFLANTIPNYSFSLPTSTGGALNIANSLTWTRASDTTWTTTWPNFGIIWDMKLLLAPDGKFELDAVANIAGSLKAKNNAFTLTGANGKIQSGTYETRGDTLFLAGLGGAWVRAR